MEDDFAPSCVGDLDRTRDEILGFTASVAGTYTFTTSAAFPTTVGVYGDDCGPIACGGAGSTTNDATTTVDLVAGQHVKIVVQGRSGFEAEAGPYELRIERD